MIGDRFAPLVTKMSPEQFAVGDALALFVAGEPATQITGAPVLFE